MSTRLIGAYIETAINSSKYKKALQLAKQMDASLNVLYPIPMVGPYPEHKTFQTRAEGFAKDILNYNGPRDHLAINYGDSIVDMWRTRFKSIDIPMSVGGFHHYHMLHMAQVMKPFLDAKKLYPKYIMIGTLGGNPLLQHQELNNVITKSYECLDGLRTMYPATYTKLIVYGLPPVVATYATLLSISYEEALYRWVLKDANSVFIPMFKRFAGKWGLMPQTYMTADGVHLSPVGQVLLDERFEVAKTAIPKSIVDYC